ncbi:MAG: hypothetical protein ABIN91_19710 [Mucilaginibacter sp.]|uniref:hypothetical protein n=1 Tax=Mucilaginibacter sp. TaxID=1882438 RepID=UPI003264A7C2
MNQQSVATATNKTATPTPATTPFALALQSPRACDAEPKQLEMVLAQAMAKAFADMGINTADRRDEIAYLVQNMPAELTRNLPAIRLNEIPVAINRGILQQFGPFYGLNVATFMHFLMAHYQSEQRLAAIKANLAAATTIPQRAIPTPHELHQNRLNRIATAFNQYKTEGHYNDYGSLVFDTINAMGKIPFGTAREAQILERAKQNLVDRYSRVSLYPDERANLRATLSKIIHGEAPNLILTEAKRIALFELFDGLIEKGVGVLDWVGEPFEYRTLNTE